jgi:hypothetical protein
VDHLLAHGAADLLHDLHVDNRYVSSLSILYVGSIPMMQYLIDRYVPRYGDNAAAICSAVALYKAKSLHMLLFLMACKPNFDLVMPDLFTHALYCHAVYGHLDIVQYLLETWPAHTLDSFDLRNVIRGAIENGHLDVLKYLFGKYPDHEKQPCHHDAESGWCGLCSMFMSCMYHKDVCKYLLETCFSDHAAREEYVHNKLLRCCIQNKAEAITAFLIENYGLRTDRWNSTQRIETAARATWEMFQYLIHHGHVVINDENKHDLMNKCIWSWDNVQVLNYLLEHHHINLPSQMPQYYTRIPMSRNTLQFLVQHLPVHTDSYAVYALIYHADTGNLDGVKTAVESGRADMDITGNIALERSAKNGHFEVVKYLVEQCHISGYAASYDRDVIFITLNAGQYPIARYLIEARDADHTFSARVVASYLCHECSDIHILQYFIDKHGRHIDSCVYIKCLFALLSNAVRDGHLDVVQYIMTTYSKLVAIVLPRLTCYFKHVSFDALPSLQQLCYAVLLNHHQAPGSLLKSAKTLRDMEAHAGEALDRVYALLHTQ